MSTQRDVVDGVVDDVKSLYPKIDVAGLQLTGRVLRLAQMLQAQRDQQLAPFGLTVPDFDVLASLRRRSRGGSVNVRDLQQSTMLSSGGMTKRLDRLENAGYLTRQPDPSDRRGVLITLTPTGRSVIDRAIPALLRFEAEFVKSAIGSATTRTTAEEALRRLLIATGPG